MNEITTLENDSRVGFPSEITEFVGSVDARFQRIEENLLDQRQVLQVQAEMLRELLKLIQNDTPCTGQQVKFLQEAVREKSRAILAGNQIAKRAGRTVSAAIKKSVFRRYGISSFEELPRYCYEAALGLIDGWFDSEAIMRWMMEYPEVAE